MPKEFREKFKNTEKHVIEKANPLLEEIIKQEQNKTRRYADHTSGGLLSVNVVDTDIKNEDIAFIIEKHYGVPNAGIRYSLDFGVVRGDNLARNGFYTVRGGTASETDDRHGWYSQVKILEQRKGNVVIGLHSGPALDIYKVKNNGRIERIKRYDLEAEKKELEKQKLIEKAHSTKSFQGILTLWSKKLSKDHVRAHDPVAETFTRAQLKIGLIAIATSDRDYDPNLEAIYFYGMNQEDKEPKSLHTHHPAYHVEGRFFAAGVDISFQDLGDKIKATMKYYYTYSTPSMYSRNSRGPKQEEVILKI